jgi:hypothetical protein
MNDSSARSPRSVYLKEEVSPDGVWRVAYDYMDGEKSPLIVSPRVIEITTGRIVIDLWRSSLDGTVENFSPGGFHVTVRDPFYPKEIGATIDATTGTFTLHEGPAEAHPLAEFDRVLRNLIDQARVDYRDQVRRSAPPPAPVESLWSRLRRRIAR